MEASSYLLSPSRTLYQACHGTGRSLNGTLCTDCCVYRLCRRTAGVVTFDTEQLSNSRGSVSVN